VAQTFQIGKWTFAPASNALHEGEKTVKLEHRVAKALELLCQRNGEVVSQDEFAARLWGERNVSDNSLAVVIGDLRRALGDNARNPQYVETVTKGGYWLIAPVTAVNSPAGVRQFGLTSASVAVIAVLVLISMLYGAWRWSENGASPQAVVVVTGLPNATGNGAYDPLANASENLVLTDLRKYSGLQIIQAAPADVEKEKIASALKDGLFVVRLETKLVLWSGQPDITFTAKDARTSVVLWSGLAYGRENTLPSQISEQVSSFAKTLASQSGGAQAM